MPAAGLTSGIDYKITFTDANGVEDFEIFESMTAKEDATTTKEIAMDGNVRHPKFHQGWSGELVFQRNSNFLDKYFANQESDYYLGIDQMPMTITETITNPNGSVNQYQFTQVVLVMENSGNRSGTEIQKQTINFQASRRLTIL